MPTPPAILLRPTTPADLPAIYQFQLDPDANALAGTRPRDLASFNARWTEVIADPAATTRVIVASHDILGCINCLKDAEKHFLGYWIAREHWGKGVATRAIALMLREVKTRPLHAQVAVHNVASSRALERNGFTVTGRYQKEASDRLLPGERLGYMLA